MTREIKDEIRAEFLAYGGYLDRRLARKVVKGNFKLREAGVKAQDILEFLACVPGVGWV